MGLSGGGFRCPDPPRLAPPARVARPPGGHLRRVGRLQSRAAPGVSIPRSSGGSRPPTANHQQRTVAP
eukprot:11841313-Alexandrium_andersonii.AAC.1